MSGPQIPTKLLATPWSASKETYYKQLRKIQLDSTFDWGAQGFSFILPRSLNAITDVYLRIDLPTLNPGENYKFSRGKYCIDSMSFRSNGSEIYRIDSYELFLREWEEGLSVEELAEFRRVFMGCNSSTTRTHVGSTVFIPLALPQTRYARYAHQEGVNYGVLPCRFGNSTTEIVLNMNTAAHLTLDASHVVPSIAGTANLEFKELVGKPSLINAFSEGRGSYSTALPQYIPLNADFQNLTANTKHTFRQISPTGSVYSLVFYLLNQGSHVHQENDASAHLTSITVRLDSETVIDMDEHEIKMSAYAHGYRQTNNVVDKMPRLQFNTMGSKASISFRGAIDFRNIQNCEIDITVNADCKCRLYSTRYSRIVLLSSGEFRKYLD
ncbi:MAG: hypothetical protein CMJ75_07370 [Planctomycetaceae bacterium]|nr:hypothetical protein [Planctomycetaceae bacterium]